ncbi:hypothetical protein HEK131_29040 [Streptomyces seoulensis]|nr:hypothetical protein HEK131_29040 [Streptomyces seoulensis]
MPLAQAERVGQGVEQMGTALVERADDRCGQGVLREMSLRLSRRSRSGQAWHTRMTEGRERAFGAVCMTLASFPVRLGACCGNTRAIPRGRPGVFAGRAAGAGAA